MPPVLWTIGHSTRPLEEFIGLLKAHDVQLLLDVRSIPYSRRYPQFHTRTLATALADAGVQYRHLPALGGRRESRPDSMNLGWRNAGFRGYADYMQTEAFQRGLEELMGLAASVSSSPARPGRAKTRPFPGTVIMCAEAVPWRCHRSLIADALVIRSWEVRHILSSARADTHTLTSFAALVDGRLVYPSADSAEGKAKNLEMQVLERGGAEDDEDPHPEGDPLERNRLAELLFPFIGGLFPGRLDLKDHRIEENRDDTEH
jgi:uncharacterized protein (DUF488 family)